MKIILAQGNPEPDYAGTRHNIGFLVIDAFARDHSASFVTKTKFQAAIAEIGSGEDKVLLVKPVTFYNETGTTARALIDFYKLNPIDVLVVHDDLALPFGTIRTREKGSDAGNNGIKSLNSHIGPNYRRARIGIWNEQRNLIGDVDFVLGKFTTDEQSQLPEIIKKAHHVMDEFVAGSFASLTM